MVNGVTPRIHGNQGKKPPNKFPLDTYQQAAVFLQNYISTHSPGSSNTKKQNKAGKPFPIFLPVEITRKKVHNAYREYCEHFVPDVKVMGYSSFRHFMKDKFPNVRFFRIDKKVDRTHSDDDDDDEPINITQQNNQNTQQNQNTHQHNGQNEQKVSMTQPNNSSNNNIKQNDSGHLNANNNNTNNSLAVGSPCIVTSSHLQNHSVIHPASMPSSTNATNIVNSTHNSQQNIIISQNSSHPPLPTLVVAPPSHSSMAAHHHPMMAATAATAALYPAYSHVQLPLNLQTQQPLYSACMQPAFPPPPGTQPPCSTPHTIPPPPRHPFPYTNL